MNISVHLDNNNSSLFPHPSYKTQIFSGNNFWMQTQKLSMVRNSGKSFSELLAGLTIIAILISVVIPQIKKYYKTYKYQQRLLEIESTLKWARMLAMERGINVGICVTSSEPNTLRIHNMEMRRSSICTGEILKRVKIEEPFISLTASGGGSAFDPRGFAIFSSSIVIRRNDDKACSNYTITPLRGYTWRKECQN